MSELVYRRRVNRAVLTSVAVLLSSSAGFAACSSDPVAPSGPTGASGSGGSAGTTSTSITTSTSATTASTGSGGPACIATTFGGDRPVDLHVPSSYACDKGAPLVIMLHGYTASGALEELYLNITAESNKRGFLYAHPDGTKSSTNKQFWNATDACCNFEGSKVDDSAYLSKLIKDIQAAFNVDSKRIYLIGHSNGAFMSYRMACEHGDQIAAFASLAGAMYSDVAKCTPQTPVSLLEIHGTADGTIAYTGGAIGAATYPSAETSVADWVTFNKCNPAADTSGAPLDLESTLAGNETKITSYSGCQAGTGVALWTIVGGSHLPSFTPSFIPGVMDFLYAHPKL